MVPSPRLSIHFVLLLAVATPLCALSGLDRPRTSFLQDVLSSSSSSDYCKPTGLIQDACCDFESVESVNLDLSKGLQSLVKTPYFRYHKVDLYRECPFWQENGACMNRACGVETTDEEHVPEALRSHKLGELKDGSIKSSAELEETDTKQAVDDPSFCVLEDEDDSEGMYVDLIENPERFTGYAGPSASRVWKAIYEENCFSPVPFIDPSRQETTGFASLSSFGLVGGGGGAWGENEKKLFGSLAAPRDEGEEQCLEKRVFYRIISGLHASISIHICDEYLDQATGEWSPNLDCFITRISQHPERLENMYFAYVVALRALSKSGPELLDAMDASDAKNDLTKLVDTAQGCGMGFDERSMFSGAEADLLKTEFKSHFRNISRIMDCVGCDKCRLWGKLQVTGLGTALKLLFSENKSGPMEPRLSRGEVVSFVNTLNRLSESLAAVERFRALWAKQQAKEAVQTIEKEEKPERMPKKKLAQGRKGKAAASPPIQPPPEEIPISSSSSSPASPATPPTATKVSRSASFADSSLDDHEESNDGRAKSSRSSARAKLVWEKLGTLCQESWRACWELLWSGSSRPQGRRDAGVAVVEKGDDL